MDDDADQVDARAERVDRVILTYLEDLDAGRAPDRLALLAHHPDLADELRSFFADHDGVDVLTVPLRSPGPAPGSGDEPRQLPAPIGGYRPLRFLGAGGMGRVFEAEDPFGRRVALKILSPHFAGSRTVVERFRQEGRLASRVTHPRCVFIYKADTEDGRPYIAMELMSGTTLKDVVERDGPLPVGEAVARILDVLEGLCEAHRAGIIHRDVKPANCFVEADGRVKIGDFGLSRSLTANLQLTQTGGFVGTPLYASPEQLRGDPLDPRTDVYSVAATLWYLLTGQAPFEEAQGASLVARVVSEPAPSPRRLRPDVPPTLEAVVLRGLERQRERRFADVDEFRVALLPLLPGRLAIAGLGRRLGAYLLDALPFTMASTLVNLALTQSETQPTLPVYLLFVLPVVLYFWLGDAWGGTLGKRLMRLRVNRATDGEPPGLVRAGVRTVLFFGMSGILVDLVLYGFLGRQERLSWALWHLAGGLLGLALCMSTLRARNGYRGLHEWLSGTRIVQLPPALPAGRREPKSPEQNAPPADLCPPNTDRMIPLPDQVGPFRIRGILRRDTEECLLLGEDATLQRRVWLRLRPRGRDGLPAARKAVARPTRLRWLAEGECDEWHWDAFVAPAGEGLADLVARQGPLDWPAVRGLLESLTEELQAAVADETMPSDLSLQQVIVQPPGRVQLLDGPVTDGNEPAASEEQALTFLRGVAAFALTGEAGRPSTQAVVPRHAWGLLRRLAGEPAPYRRLAELQADLAATRDRPAEITPILKALQLALSSCFLLLGLIEMLAWARFGSVTRILLLDRDMVQVRTLQHALQDEAARETLLRDLPKDACPRRDLAAFGDLLEQRLADDHGELVLRLHGPGRINSFFQIVPLIRADFHLGDAEAPLHFERHPDEPLSFWVTRSDLPAEEAVVVDGPQLRRAVAEMERDPSILEAERNRSILLGGAFVLAFCPALWVTWAFLLRGGLGLRLAGLALVRSGGRDALRLQCLWRALLVWAPVVAVLMACVWVDLRFPAGYACAGLQGLTLLLLLAYVALALRFPGRGPHDYLAGTYLVPR